MTMYQVSGRKSAACLIDVYQSEFIAFLWSIVFPLFWLWHARCSETYVDWLQQNLSARLVGGGIPSTSQLVLDSSQVGEIHSHTYFQ